MRIPQPGAEAPVDLPGAAIAEGGELHDSFMFTITVDSQELYALPTRCWSCCLGRHASVL